jgi:NAD(P)-dependent dehydrogenase (short-subunit alcohol dehydrogenase family)
MSWGPFDLTGKAALVTGAAQGIGFGCAKMLYEAGASVMIADRDGDAAAEAVKRIAADPDTSRVASATADVTSTDDIDAMVAATVAAFGGVDVLVNNAGIVPVAPLVDTDPEALRRVLSVNVEGVILTTKAVARSMIDRGGGGSIVNIASMDALHPTYPGISAYGATKGAVVSFTLHAANELGQHGIRVNVIAPGVIWTEGGEELAVSFGVTEQMRRDRTAVKQPLGRDGTPADIAAVAVFLASSAASFVTGTTILADGGTLLT